ncbi:MAG: glycosyltransferase [Thermodesulfobacteriota bacterium]
MQEKKIDDDIKVSIIVRAFNEERHIGKLFYELFHQKTSFRYEVILIDSGSTDASLDIVAKYNQVIVVQISPEDFSFGYSLNKGIEKAHGEYCVFISAHCYPVSKNWLQKLIEPFNDNKVALVYGKQRGNHNTRYSECQIFRKWFPDKSVKRQDLAFCNNANVAIRRDIWKFNKFNEKLTGLEDINWAREVITKGYYLSYSSEAEIVHVHNETWGQVYRRYEREALAFNEIYPNETFTFFDSIKLFLLNTSKDYSQGYREGKLFSNILDIPIFRFLQFYGTYKAHSYKKKEIPSELKHRLYYPRNPEVFTFERKRLIPEREGEHREIFDVSRPLSPNLPVWPGDSHFKLEYIKNNTEHGVNVSQVTFNVHTGTHIDAPSHFIPNGKRLLDIPLSRLIGEAYVLEYFGKESVSKDFFQDTFIPEGCIRLLLKTLNSAEPNNNSKCFNEDFVAITPDGAKWLVDYGINLIGVDGPSVQQYNDKDNSTHTILMENDIIIIEGINLLSVSQGIYDLIALPLNIPEAEGGPARVILVEK